MAFGYLDTQFIDLPDNMDPAYLQGLQMRSGVSFATILSELDNRIRALNGTSDPLVAALVYTTTDIVVDLTGVPAFTVEEETEYGLPRPQHADVGGHMLPIRRWDILLGVTEDGLMELPLRKLTQQFDGVMAGFRALYRRRALQRFFSDAEVLVDKKVKTAVKSPGFAGSGTGDNVFNVPYPDGTPLPGGYTHYYRDTSANRAVVLASAHARLRRWHPPPYDMLGSQAFIDAARALPLFVSAGSALVRVGSGTAEAQVDPTLYAGVYDGDIRVRLPILDYTEDTGAIFKTYGNFNVLNPLAWRYDDRVGRPAYVRSRELFPLHAAMVKQRFDVGVSSRTTGVFITIAASGNYTPPVIS